MTTITRLKFLLLVAVPALVALAIAGCGGQGTVTNLPVRQKALAHPPVGCSHHLVYASHGPAGRKIMALSFDDGPSPYTERLFKTLVRYHVAGTFFMIGERVANLIEQTHGAGLLREMVDHGMEIGNHSYNHPRDLPEEGEGASLQLELTNREIERASGFEPCLFRPPYGNLTPELVQRAKVLGLTTVKWDVDPEDWRHPGVSVIRERVLSGAKPGAIVVMHDNIETHGQTVEALPGIIEGLEGRGYHLVTITQLLGDGFVLHRPPRRHGRLNPPVRGSEGE
jgi:peptidoglycan/xylan/chitin deacetylase (PgdA/CDA1 family)